MSDTLAEINVDLLSSAVSEAVNLGRLDESPEIHPSTSHVASPGQDDNDLFKSPSQSAYTISKTPKRSSKTSHRKTKTRKKSRTETSCTSDFFSVNTHTHISTVKPCPGPSSNLASVLGATKTVYELSKHVVPILPKTVPSAYGPVIKPPPFMSSVTKSTTNETVTSTSTAPSSPSPAQSTSNLQQQCVSMSSRSSTPTDLLAAATQAAIPHLVAHYAKSPEEFDISSPDITNSAHINTSVDNSGSGASQPVALFHIISPQQTITSGTTPYVFYLPQDSNGQRRGDQGVVLTTANGSNYPTRPLESDSNPHNEHNKKKTVYSMLMDKQRTIKDLVAEPDLDSESSIPLSNSDNQTETTESELFVGNFCADCDANDRDNWEECLHHPTPTAVQDTIILSRARMSLPSGLEIREDAKQKQRIFALKPIPARTRFGPLVAKVLVDSDVTESDRSESCYLWKIFKSKDEHVTIDCTDESLSNWMRFVRVAHSSAEQNLIAFQENHLIYFISSRDIQPGSELLYWYARGYARILGKNIRPEDWFTCGACKKKFEDMHSVTQHIRYAHPDKTHRKWQCEVCERTFTSATKLNTHKMCHSGLKPHKCKECSKCFTDQSNLRIHMLTHSGERKFKCSMCIRAFRQKAHLQSHQLTHTGEKRMACRYCHKLFARRSDVRVHELQHTKERVFTCTEPECGKEFYKLQSYNKHMLIHSGVRNFSCDRCEKAFVTRYHLQRHNKSCLSKNKAQLTAASSQVQVMETHSNSGKLLTLY